MPEVGDVVIYGSNGVCSIKEITTNDFGEYFVLVPLNKDRTKISIPVANETLVGKMRPIPQKEEAQDALKRAIKSDPYWEENDSARRDSAKEVLVSGDEFNLLLLVKSFCLHRQQVLDAGKKVHLADDSILKQGMKRLHEEYCAVFDITEQQVDELLSDIVPVELMAH